MVWVTNCRSSGIGTTTVIQRDGWIRHVLLLKDFVQIPIFKNVYKLLKNHVGKLQLNSNGKQAFLRQCLCKFSVKLKVGYELPVLMQTGKFIRILKGSGSAFKEKTSSRWKTSASNRSSSTLRALATAAAASSLSQMYTFLQVVHSKERKNIVFLGNKNGVNLSNVGTPSPRYAFYCSSFSSGKVPGILLVVCMSLAVQDPVGAFSYRDRTILPKSLSSI